MIYLFYIVFSLADPQGTQMVGHLKTDSMAKCEFVRTHALQQSLPKLAPGVGAITYCLSESDLDHDTQK